MVTDANVNYEGSLTIDQTLMDEADLLPFERVLCGTWTMRSGSKPTQ